MKVICPNILASRYAQRRLSEKLGIHPLVKGKFYDDSYCFSVIFPPCFCDKSTVDKIRKENYGGCPIHTFKENPIICSCKEDLPIEQYTPMLDALRFLSLVESMK